MKKNYLHRTLLLTLIVIVLLMAAYFVTPIQIGDFAIKKVDIFSEIRYTKNTRIPPGEKTINSLAENIEKDSCGIHFTCIEDFSGGFNSLRRFYSLLDSIPQLNRPVRIAFFGDSFIESDIVTADIREQLQGIFGGCGVGYMPLTSVAPGYRKSILHSFQNFTTTSLIKNEPDVGISGYGFRARGNAKVSYQGTTYKKRLSGFSVVRLLYEGSTTGISSYSINRQGPVSLELNKQPGMQQTVIKNDSIHSVSFSFSSGTLLYGIYLDCSQGIAVDNFAIRGHTGMSLMNVPEKIYRETDKLIPYDLIVLQYGLNVVGANTSNYDIYKQKMLENIAYLKKKFPQAGFILMGVGDRGMRSGGDYVTMPGVFNLIPVQKEIANESQIAFWNTFQAMGGESSIEKLVSSQPPLAAKDYTHLTHEGGEIVATEFVKALLYGKRKME